MDINVIGSYSGIMLYLGLFQLTNSSDGVNTTDHTGFFKFVSKVIQSYDSCRARSRGMSIMRQ